jgi:hypothetical protein
MEPDKDEFARKAYAQAAEPGAISGKEALVLLVRHVEPYLKQAAQRYALGEALISLGTTEVEYRQVVKQVEERAKQEALPYMQGRHMLYGASDMDVSAVKTRDEALAIVLELGINPTDKYRVMAEFGIDEAVYSKFHYFLVTAHRYEFFSRNGFPVKERFMR